ncbi:MAG: hypothetical protein ACK5RG_03470 [Cyclobacteriaceae bacterium]|jgi:hypothetical protein|nr:hypothetical protein [Flammeovirgaceae bacterium]
MRTEEQCKPSERFLFAEEYFSDKAIAIWQSECVKRCTGKQKGKAYDRFVRWTRRENEIAVFMLYAYADFDIPKKFDVIFDLANPNEFLKIDYQLTQAVHEAWFPLDNVGHGHKHLCIFSFEESLPDMLRMLHKTDTNCSISKSPKDQKMLGFCHSKDFDEIKAGIGKELLP